MEWRWDAGSSCEGSAPHLFLPGFRTQPMPCGAQTGVTPMYLLYWTNEEDGDWAFDLWKVVETVEEADDDFLERSTRYVVWIEDPPIGNSVPEVSEGSPYAYYTWDQVPLFYLCQILKNPHHVDICHAAAEVVRRLGIDARRPLQVERKGASRARRATIRAEHRVRTAPGSISPVATAPRAMRSGSLRSSRSMRRRIDESQSNALGFRPGVGGVYALALLDRHHDCYDWARRCALDEGGERRIRVQARA